VCLSVCLCEHISRTTRPLFANFGTYYLWRWLGPPLAALALRYVMYFRFYGWRHICTYWSYGAYRSIPLQRVTSLRRREQDIVSAPLLRRIGRVLFIMTAGDVVQKGVGHQGRSLRRITALFVHVTYGHASVLLWRRWLYVLPFLWMKCLQCSDTVGWASGRAPGL